MQNVLSTVALGVITLGLGLASGLSFAAEQEDRAAADYRAAVKRAEATYRSSLDRCRKMTEGRDGCMEQAKAVLQQSTLHAKVQFRSASASAMAKTDPREANYRAALGRCEFYHGRAKNICVNETNAEYGRIDDRNAR